MENKSPVPQEQRQILIDSGNQEQNFSEQHRPISKLEFNQEAIKSKNQNSSPSNNNSSQEQK
jgi:hypothetical protein